MLFTPQGQRVFPVGRDEKEIDVPPVATDGQAGAGAPAPKEPPAVAPGAAPAWSWPPVLAGAAAGFVLGAAAVWLGLRRGRPAP
jgi:hypothetical protein